MTDWFKDTGSSGQMRIRDTGTRVEFALKAGSATFNHDLGWGYTVNGVTDNSNSFDFQSGGSWQTLRTFAVSESQTVYFRLQDSGTSGLGGPTVFSHAIDRAAPPNPPPKPSYSNVTSNSIYVTFSDGANNGAPIDQRQIGYGTNSASPSQTVSSDGSTTITGLTPGTRYYFRARTHNSEGWSPWSVYTGATMLDEPSAPGGVSVGNITQTSVSVSFKDPTDTGGSAILERQIGYGTYPATPTTTVNYPGPITISNLKPGTQYYFRSRTRNAVGWSPWSAATIATTIAGAFVKVGGVWKPAVPYVRVGGVWKVARPWGRIVGYWEDT